MFAERLESIRSRLPGARALSLTGPDGMPVVSVGDYRDLDLEALTAELTEQMRSIAEDQQDLPVGGVRLLAVTTDRYTVMVSSVAAGYSLILVLTDGAPTGRARFELRRARLWLEDELI